MATVVQHAFVLRSSLVRGAACALLALATAAGAAGSAGATAHPLIGKLVPEMSQRLITGPSRNFRLSERRGEVVVLGFWTSWCGSCRSYLERLAKLDATYASAGLVVVGMSLDDDAGKAAEFARAVGARFRNGVDVRKVLGRRFSVAEVPLTLLIDRDGIVRYAHGELDAAADAELLLQVRQLLDE